MIDYSEFILYTNIDDLKNIGEIMTENTQLHGLKQHSPKIYFEESLFLKQYKIKYVAIKFPDNDIVSYIFKYTQIFNTKSYRLTTLPISESGNKLHEALILIHLYNIAKKELSITVNINEIHYPLSEYKIIGYENYYFTYKNLYTKIIKSKSNRYYYNRYSNLKIIEILPNEINNNVIDIILNIYNQWESLHPNPVKSTKKHIINILKSPPSDLRIFIGQLNENNIYFSLTTKHSDHFTCCYAYGLTRNPKYNNIDLICILHILQYIEKKYNILLYYYLGYTENNKSLKYFKDKWADDKIIIYKICHKNFFQECNNMLNVIGGYYGRNEI